MFAFSVPVVHSNASVLVACNTGGALDLNVKARDLTELVNPGRIRMYATPLHIYGDPFELMNIPYTSCACDDTLMVTQVWRLQDQR